MCRMLAAAGPRASIVGLAKRFQLEASLGRVGATMTPGHADGWGIAYSRAPRDLHYAGRSTHDAARDAAYAASLDALDASAPERTVMLAHVRKRTMGRATLRDTHPFISEGYAFAHNGTVRGIAPEGESDSRVLFARILAEIAKGSREDDAIATVARDIDSRGRETYTSLTLLLTDGASIWGLLRIGADPVVCAPAACPQDYYTLGHARLDDGTLVVSQEHELFGLADWTPIADGELVNVAPDRCVTVRSAI